MAIKEITAYAHLSAEDVEEIGRRFDAIEKRHRETLGAKDAAYIRNLIRTQRGLDLLSRVATVFAPALATPAAATMGLAKILENLEIGHNVMHGQWDWMNDPEIHSTTWEWDNTGPSSGWKHSHNFSPHVPDQIRRHRRLRCPLRVPLCTVNPVLGHGNPGASQPFPLTPAVFLIPTPLRPRQRKSHGGCDSRESHVILHHL